ncbi:MAG: YdbL family protein [Hyphomonadaceae bacterium]
MITRTTLMMAATGLALCVAVAPAIAQSDPAYQAARESGQIGEKTDGFLGIVGAATPALQAMVDDLNIRRHANYNERAQANGVTLIDYATAQGCIRISRTAPGEMYQAPDGGWRQRSDDSAPQLAATGP